MIKINLILTMDEYSEIKNYIKANKLNCQFAPISKNKFWFGGGRCNLVLEGDPQDILEVHNMWESRKPKEVSLDDAVRVILSFVGFATIFKGFDRDSFLLMMIGLMLMFIGLYYKRIVLKVGQFIKSK